ncbi:MAG: LptF/LptG family permease [Planctomycetia bacterium]|nr:LptF/LptG family permease [Planctomycetia bacterium]
MLGSTLNRMIFWELVRVFLLSLGTLTSLFLIVGLIQQASQLGLSLWQIVRAVPLFVPSTLPLTIPATTLFASCVVYGRLAHDNEVVALKAAGVHLFGVIKPAILLGVLTTAATAVLYHTIIPATQQMLYEQILADPEEVLYNTLRRDRCLRHPTMQYVVYTRDVQGKRLIDVVIKRRVKAIDKQTNAEVSLGYDFVARMREARLRVDKEAGTMSIEPEHYVLSGKTTSLTIAGPMVFEQPLPDSVSGKEAKLRISALTWKELPARIATVREELDTIIRQRDQKQAEADSVTEPNVRALRQNDVKNFKFLLDSKTRHLRNLQAEIHARPALALSCLVFALIGCPVGIWANRSDYLSTFVMCFIPTLAVYYPLLLAGSDMGKTGKLPLALGCWLADIIVGALAIVLTWRLLRR